MGYGRVHRLVASRVSADLDCSHLLILYSEVDPYTWISMGLFSLVSLLLSWSLSLLEDREPDVTCQPAVVTAFYLGQVVKHSRLGNL